MNLPELMSWLQQLPFAVSIAEGDLLFPLLESVHVLAVTLVVGTVAMMDLRLLGLTPSRKISEVLESSLPFTWGAFLVALVAGGALFCSKAVTYYGNIPFRIKMVCLLLAGVNMLVFHRLTARRVSDWDCSTPPAAARVAGGISILLWITIVATGRWIGFTT
jgi:hypothetical protein